MEHPPSTIFRPMAEEKDLSAAQQVAVDAATMPIHPGQQLKAVLPAVASRYTEDQLKEVIDKHFGVVTSIVNDIDCTYPQFYKAIKKYNLQGYLQEAKRNIISLAEAQIVRSLNNPEEAFDAAKFILERLGKNEGWSRDPSVAVGIQVDSKDKETKIKAIFGIVQEAL